MNRADDGAAAERLILERCAGQIAAAAGAGAVVIEIGAGLGANTDILVRALRAPAGHVSVDLATVDLPRAARAGTGRTVVVVPGSALGAVAPAAAGALLRRIGQWAGAHALLVAGALACSDPARAFDRSIRVGAGAHVRVQSAYSDSLPGIVRLANGAGWTHCQFWADGRARYALHVLERVR